MSDHYIIQIESSIKIVVEKLNQPNQEKQLKLLGLNFFNEDISWGSIDADLLNTSLDML